MSQFLDAAPEEDQQRFFLSRIWKEKSMFDSKQVLISEM